MRNTNLTYALSNKPPARIGKIPVCERGLLFTEMNHLHKCKFCGNVFTSTHIKSDFCPTKTCRLKFKYWTKNDLFKLIIPDKIIDGFKDIKGYESIYKIDINGNVLDLKKKIYIKQSYVIGYLGVTLCKDGNRSLKYVHRLVAETFIPNPLNKPQVNHKDGNKENNHIDNLEWATSKENINHSWEIGLSKPGQNRYNRKTTDNQVMEIRRRFDYGFKIKEIAKYMNLSEKIISNIIHGKTCKYIK